MLTEAEARKLGFEIARRTDVGPQERAADDWYIRRPAVDPSLADPTQSGPVHRSRAERIEALENELRWRDWFLGL